MRWIAWIALGIVMLGMFDAAGRLMVLKDGTRLAFAPSTTSNSRRLFVYYPGILADGVMSSLEVLPTWRQHGDVLMVSYAGKRFVPSDVTSMVAKWILMREHDYNEIVFIGSSMGGLLAYDTYATYGPSFTQKVKFVLVDAPTKRSDFQSPLDKISLATWAWWAGPLSNLLSKPYFNMTFVEPDPKNIEKNVDRAELAQRVKEAKSFPLSTHNDWIRYIIGHKPLLPDLFAGIDAVYVRSLRDDDTVRPAAFDSWKPVFGSGLKKISVDTTHVGYNERPMTWLSAFSIAFDTIGVR